MSENVKTPSITRESQLFDKIGINETVQGMRYAAHIDRTINEAEIAQQQNIEQASDEIPVPTGDDIRQDRENGEYR